MRKISILILILNVFTISHMIYKSFLAPTTEISRTYIVKQGDTMWDICNDMYITRDNAESFNEFFYRNSKDKRILQIGEQVIISNILYR